MGCSDSKSPGSGRKKEKAPTLLDTTNEIAINRAKIREQVEREGERLTSEAEGKLIANERMTHTKALLLQSSCLDKSRALREIDDEDEEESSSLYSARTSHLHFTPPSEMSSCIMFANLPTCRSIAGSTASHETILIDSNDPDFVPYICHRKSIVFAEDGEYYKQWFRSIRNTKTLPAEPLFGELESSVGSTCESSIDSPR